MSSSAGIRQHLSPNSNLPSRGKTLLYVLVATAAFWALICFVFPHMIITGTPSLNDRVFWASKDKEDLAQVKSGSFLNFYLRIPGPGKNKVYLVTKRVGCSPGETLKISGKMFFCNDRFLGVAKERGRSGIKLTQFQEAGPIPADHYFLVGDDPYSYDSRYWGLLDKKLAAGVSWPIGIYFKVLFAVIAMFTSWRIWLWLKRRKFVATAQEGVLALVSLAMIAGTASAGQDGQGGGKYYEFSDKPGYYWGKDPYYEDLKKEKEDEPKPAPAEKPPVQKEVKKDKRFPSMSDYTVQQLWAMYPDDFQELSERFKKKAVTTLSPKDVEDHMFILDLAARRATAFSSVQTYVQQRSTKYSAVDRSFPVSFPGAQARTRELAKEQYDLLNDPQWRDKYALIYFYSHGCDSCKEAAPLVVAFNKVKKWEIKDVEVSEQPQLAARFNVTQVPTVFLIRKGKQDPVVLAAGVVALGDMQTRAYQAIRSIEGMTQPEEYGQWETDRGGSNDVMLPLREE